MGIEENQIDLLSCLKVGDKSIVKASERVAFLNDFLIRQETIISVSISIKLLDFYNEKWKRALRICFQQMGFLKLFYQNKIPAGWDLIPG